MPAIQLPVVRVHYQHGRAEERLSHFLAEALEPGVLPSFLCVGTDRSTGDALGPLVGTFLVEEGPGHLEVRGTLDQPVHAGNLVDAATELKQSRPGGKIIAIDACLGRTENIGTITAASGALRPGAGVRKNLPSVGDLNITATVNVAGFMEFFVLQNTRLSLVMAMAHIIGQSSLRAVRQMSPKAALPGVP